MEQLKNHEFWWWEVMSNIRDEVTLAALVVTISVVILAILWNKLTLRSTSPLPPGPSSLPIVGYLPFLRADLHNQFTNMAHIYGPIFKFRIGNKLQVVINTPELVKEVVRDQDEIFANRGVTIASSVYSYGGQDIAYSDSNSNWRKLRKIFVHEVLGNKNLEVCGSIRKYEIRKLVKDVFSKLGTTVNISDISFSFAANVLERMLWDNSSDEVAEDLRIVVSKIIEIIGQPNLSDYFPSLAWFDLQGIEQNMKREHIKLERIFESIIDDRVKSNSKILADAKKEDLLQVLLDLKDKNDATSVNIIQIKSLLMESMISGTDTPAGQIEWAMVEIMRNHKVMKRIQEELAEVVGVDNIVEESHLVKLHYLDATVKETLRLHHALLIHRVPSKDCTVGGYTIPKGTDVFMNVWSIHHDPRYWDNPLEFNPERFLTNKETDKCDYNGNNLKFIPFGSGRRVCPGIPLAEKIQMFILASLLHSFDWSLPEGEEHDLSVKSGTTRKKRKPLIAIPSQRLHDVSLYV